MRGVRVTTFLPCSFLLAKGAKVGGLDWTQHCWCITPNARSNLGGVPSPCAYVRKGTTNVADQTKERPRTAGVSSDSLN